MPQVETSIEGVEVKQISMGPPEETGIPVILSHKIVCPLNGALRNGILFDLLQPWIDIPQNPVDVRASRGINIIEDERQ